MFNENIYDVQTWEFENLRCTQSSGIGKGGERIRMTQIVSKVLLIVCRKRQANML